MRRTLLILLIAGMIVPVTGAGQAAQNPDVVGTWEMTTNSPEGARTNTSDPDFFTLTTVWRLR